MAQFVKNGPDIPNRLLQAHEDGKVVFFCGAGVSASHLPGFCKLVCALVKEFGFGDNKGIAKAIRQGQYEVAVQQMDDLLPGGRSRVREAIARQLTPDRDICSVMHRSLMDLSRTHHSREPRIVTTNFDCFFERAIGIGNENIKRYQAPALPVPNDSRDWSGLVYLHGRLPEGGGGSLDDMVISSADFGRAYILEQWAANFVRDLFRNYSVCFVGYSINDPVMRYLLDALAADRLTKTSDKFIERLSSTSDKEVYAFAGYSADGKDTAREEWESKNIEPIFYNNENNHTILHRTIRVWSNLYNQEIRGKKRIINEHAPYTPRTLNNADIGKVLWAIADPSAAKHFANLNPPPSLEWLDVFGDKRLKREDLPRFGCDASAMDEDEKFSVINRPTSVKLAPWMGFVSYGYNDGKWDSIMLHLARWLLRHLDNPKDNLELFLRLIDKGGKLHGNFARMVGLHIKNIASAPVCTLWHLLLSGRISANGTFDIHDWMNALRNKCSVFAARSRLREMLSPRITVNKRNFFGDELNPPANPKCVSDIVYCNLNLQLREAKMVMRNERNNKRWKELLPLMLDDLTALLRDAMDIMREVGEADDKRDDSHDALSSIAEHGQNIYSDDWTVLPQFTRDAWLATKESDSAKALRVAEGWQRTPYPIFKRLAFFAAAQNDIIPKRKALDWLLADDGWWLWIPETKRESIRLIVALAPKLDAKEVRELTSAILKRPPHGMHKNPDTDDYEVWQRLAKPQAAGMVLDKVAQSELDRLTDKYSWGVSEYESDEFSSYTTSEWRIGDSLPPEYVHPPKTSPELAEWLIKNKPISGWYSDDGTWQGYCANHYEVAIAALEILAAQNIFPAKRWDGALTAWSKGELLQKSWQVAPMLAKADDDLLQKTVHSMAFWLHEQGEKLPEKDGVLFLRLIRRIVALRCESGGMDGNPLSHALNVPVGRVTFGLLRWMFLQDNPKLSGDVLRLLTDLCDTAKAEYRPGRVMLAAHVKNLFYTDKEWTRRYLLPLFDWQNPQEARAAWHGFLWAPPIVLPLIEEIKDDFLRSAQHYKELGSMGSQYAGVLTVLALYQKEKPFLMEELRIATAYLPEKGLLSATDIICRELMSADERRGEYWRGSVAPYFKQVWSQRAKVTESTAQQIARICTEAGEEFADAVQELQYFLMRTDSPNDAYYGLSQHGLCGKYPKVSLDLLDAITSDAPEYWIAEQLRTFLNEVQKADGQLVHSPEYIRLDRICQKYGL